MIDFAPPVGFQDVSEHVFAGPNCRLLIRAADTPLGEAGLLTAARQHADQIQNLLDAKVLNVSGVQKLDSGAGIYVTVEAYLHDLSGDSEEWTAFVGLSGAATVQLSLNARASDQGADEEFQMIVQSVKASPTAVGGRRTLREVQRDDTWDYHHAGPVVVRLPHSYKNVTVPAFKNASGTRHLRLLMDVPMAVIAAAATTDAAAVVSSASKTSTGAVIAATDNHGNAFSYEAGGDPWQARSARLARANRDRRTDAHLASNVPTAPRGQDDARVSAQSATQVVNIAGSTVLVQARSSESAADAGALAAEAAKGIGEH